MTKIVPINAKREVWYLVEANCHVCCHYWHGAYHYGNDPYHLECPKCHATLGTAVLLHEDPMTMQECIDYRNEVLGAENQETQSSA